MSRDNVFALAPRNRRGAQFFVSGHLHVAPTIFENYRRSGRSTIGSARIRNPEKHGLRTNIGFLNVIAFAYLSMSAAAWHDKTPELGQLVINNVTCSVLSLD